MKSLNGKSVALDLEALGQLCGKCLHDIDELEIRLDRSEENSYPTLSMQLLATRPLPSLNTAARHYA